MMKIKFITVKFILVSCVIVATNSFLQAQTKACYQYRINSLNNIVYKYFYDSTEELFYETNNIRPREKAHSYLWPLCALIQASNEEENLYPGVDYMSPVLNAIRQYYSDAKPLPAYQAYVTKEEKNSRFYDDNQWIAIACLDAYNRTKKGAYLKIAKDIYQFMMTGYDRLSGGGLYWKEDEKTSKNTCSNGPAIIIALQLYELTHERKYLETALNLYKWVNANLQSPPAFFMTTLKFRL